MRGLGSGHVTCGEDLSNARVGLLHRGQTYRHTHGHRDSMTESAQWVDLGKNSRIEKIVFALLVKISVLTKKI